MLDQRINDLVDFIALRFRKRLKLVVEQRVFDGITVLEDVAKDGVGGDSQGVEDRNLRIEMNVSSAGSFSPLSSIPM